MPEPELSSESVRRGRPAKLQPEHIEALRTLVSEHGKQPSDKLAEMLAEIGAPEVSEQTLLRVLRAEGLLTPAVPGRPSRVLPEHVELLRKLAVQHPGCTVAQLGQWLVKAGGPSVSGLTISKALRKAGIVRVRPQPQLAFDAPAGSDKRYGYNDGHRDEGDDQRFPTNLTDEEWTLVSDLFEPPMGSPGKPALYPRRTIVDACCYVVRTGCAWRMLPKSFPHWDSVYKTFRRWTGQGKFEKMHDRLRAMWRQREARDVQPTVAIIDSQSTRTSPQGGEKGFDAGKRVKGRKRNLVVDSLGLLLAVVVTAASVQDRDGAYPAVAQACAKYTSLTKLIADSAYAGGCAEMLHSQHGLDVEIARHPANRSVGRWHDTQASLFEPELTHAFTPLSKRWLVERHHAWLERSRRLVMHHDRRVEVSTSWVWLAAGVRLLKGLARDA